MASIYDKSSLVLIPSGTKTGKVYSQVPVSGDGDFTFTRSSAATRVNADGFIEKETQNLLLQSNSFDTSPWFTSNASLTGGQAGYNGTNDAWIIENNSSTTTAVVQQPFSLGSSVRSFSVYAKQGNVIWLRILMYDGAVTHQCWFNLTDGSTANSSNLISASATSVGGDWYRCEISANTNITFANIYPAAVAGSSLSDLGDFIYIQDAQLEQGLVARDYIETTTTAVEGGITDNVPRLDYTDSSCPALLLEPQRTNNIPHSEYFGSGSGWSYFNNVSVGNFVLSPEGKMNATELVFDGTTSGRLERTISGLTAGADYSVSLYARVASGTQNVFFGSYQAEVFTLTTEWQRLERTQPENDTDAYPRITCDDAATIEIWGFQHEAGSYATSYIPTYGSSVTRTHEGTLGIGSMQSKGLVSGAFSFMIDFKDIARGGSSGNFIYCYTSTGANMFYVYAGSIGVHTPTGEQYLTFPEADGKFALVYDGTNVKFFKNGAKYASTYTASTRWADMNDFRLYLSGSTAKINYNETLFFNTALTDQEAIDLTTI